ncbi:MAG: hypothetical protein US81_C0017G0005 [Parcubacteria group bacterium GW2011_GWE2_38_18]|nr:MAG: hypothetical protein US81_C0017G0005 [Parcubacteria group bacterium GW2011_GWE2_38_18]
MTLTPEQYNKIVTKEYLDEKLDNFITKDEFNQKMNEVLTHLDGITKKLDNMGQEATSNIVAHDRLEEEISSHELRIKNLELKTI